MISTTTKGLTMTRNLGFALLAVLLGVTMSARAAQAPNLNLSAGFDQWLSQTVYGSVTVEDAEDHCYLHTYLSCINTDNTQQSGNTDCVCSNNTTDAQNSNLDSATTESASCGNSHIDNQTFNHIHYAYDYRVNNEGTGCGTCGAIKVKNTVPTVELFRKHRFRDVTEHSSLGPGIFLTYDLNLEIRANGSGNRVRFFDPNYFNVIRYDDGNYNDPKDGVFYENKRGSQKARRTDRLELFDGPLGTGNLTTDVKLAQSAVVYTHDQRRFIFEVITVEDGDLMGRIAAYKDRNDYGVTYTYKTWTQAEIDAAPRRQLQLDVVSDDNGRQLTFHYGAQQVAGQWVVEKVDLPNGTSVHYGYSSDRLTHIQHADGTESTFGYVFNARSNCTVIEYNDAAAESTSRRKSVYLTTNFTDKVHGSYYSVYNQSSQIVRMVTNGENEVSFMNAVDHTQWNRWLVYEGGGKIKQLGSTYTRFFNEGWSFTPGNGYQSFSGSLESKYTKNDLGGWNNQGSNTPVAVYDKTGFKREYKYNSNNYVTKITYPDGTTEEFKYNQFFQKTYIKDRLNRVTKFSFDNRGNMLTKEVGILKVNGTDVNQPEYAAYRWEYFPAGHVNQFQLSAKIDANGNVTNYTYDTNQFLVKIEEPADKAGDPRAERHFAYDTAGRVVAATDAEGRVTQVSYDSRDRITATTYNDSSTEKNIYGQPGSGNENLVVMSVDRNGNITEFEYDNHGREIKKTTGQKTMDTAGVIAVVTNAQTKVETNSLYLAGTNDKRLIVEVNGEATGFVYDYRHRIVGTVKQPKSGVLLTSTNTFEKNLLTKTTDAYGRSTHFVYRATDSKLIRKVVETAPGAIGSNSTAASKTRDLGNNADYLISDFSLDAVGQSLATTDPRGITHANTFDSRGRITQRVQASGTADAATTQTVYDAQSNIIEIKSPRALDAADSGFGVARTTMTYTGRNLLASRTEGAGSSVAATESFTYYLDQKLKTRTDFNNEVWSSVYHNCCGRKQADIDPAGHGRIYNTDFRGNITHSAVVENLPTDVAAYNWHDPINADTLNETTTRYDERNRPTHSTKWLVPLGNVVDHGRPALGNGQIPIAGEGGIPASDGLTTRYAYDDDLTDGIGLDATYASQLAGLNVGASVGGDFSAVAVTNPEGETTLTVNDSLGRPVATIDGEGDETKVVYDILSGGLLEVTTIVDPSGLALTTKRRTDGAGRLIQTVDGEGHISISEYDANGNRVKMRNPNNVGQDCVFDARNRDISCIDTHGDSRSKAYDANNNLISTTDGLGKVTSMVYDARNRITSRTNRINSTVTYAYDDNSNRTQIVDGEGGITDYAFDSRNLLIKTTYPDLGEVQVSYDGAKRRSAEVDQANDLTGFIYDMANRMTSRTYPDAKNDTFTFDGVNRVLTATSARYNNVVTRTYNDDGTLATESLTVAGQTYTLTHIYDKAGRMVECTYPDGRKVTRSWTDRNQLDIVTFAGTQIADFDYDAGGRESTRALGNGLTQTITYRADNLIDSITVPGITDFDYTYDANKRKLTEDDGEDTSLSQTFIYDDEDRLTSWSSNGTTLTQSQTFDLSLEGDWNSTTVNGVTETRGHNDVHEVTDVGGAALSYDSKGNLTTNKNGDAYSWDYDNRMNTFTGNGGGSSATYAYDALGRRVAKTVDGTTTVFVNNRRNQVVAEYATTLAPANSKRSFVYAAYVDDPILMQQSGDDYYYHSNRQYSVAAITNSSGAPVERYGYDSYGKLTVVTDDSAFDQPYFFTGRRLDSESGLFFFRARYYDSALGRFISRDPLMYVDGFNLYQGYFVPLFRDPSGNALGLGTLIGAGIGFVSAVSNLPSGSGVGTFIAAGAAGALVGGAAGTFLNFGAAASVGAGAGLTIGSALATLGMGAANAGVATGASYVGQFAGNVAGNIAAAIEGGPSYPITPNLNNAVASGAGAFAATLFGAPVMGIALMAELFGFNPMGWANEEEFYDGPLYEEPAPEPPSTNYIDVSQFQNAFSSEHFEGEYGSGSNPEEPTPLPPSTGMDPGLVPPEWYEGPLSDDYVEPNNILTSPIQLNCP